MIATNLIKIEVVAALARRALREFVPILREVGHTRCIVRLVSVHNAGTSLCDDLPLLLVWGVFHAFNFLFSLVLRVRCSALGQILVTPVVEIL